MTGAPLRQRFFPGDCLGTDGADFLPLFTQTGVIGPTDEWFARVSP